MAKEIYFFYDESGHSRKITSDTMNSDGFRNYFISAIIGVEKNVYSSFESDYSNFENKWKSFYGNTEIKSKLVKSTKYKYGLASFKKKDISFYSDLFELISKNNIYLHFGIFNKIEYLVNQRITESSLIDIINFEAISYSMAKSLCVYHPKSVLESIENNIDEFITKFKNFLEKRISLNTRINGQSEENAFKEMIEILNSINKDIKLEWNYTFSFDGFKKYTEELKLKNISLLIDKEGIGTTKNAAIKSGIKNVKEEDSKVSFGIRCADLLAGFLSNMINSIELSIAYEEDSATRDESLLPKEWFDKLPKNSFNLYKKMYQIFIDLNNSWYKYYCSLYADCFILFISLLTHIEEYDTYEKYKDDSIEHHQNRVNTILYYKLKEYHEKIDKKYNVETIDVDDKDYYFNQKGAKCFYDYKKHSFLDMPILGKNKKIFVLSVGFFGNKDNPFSTPCITISEDGKPICYLLPMELYDWAMECVYKASMFHGNTFPCFLTIENTEIGLKLTLTDE